MRFWPDMSDDAPNGPLGDDTRPVQEHQGRTDDGEPRHKLKSVGNASNPHLPQRPDGSFSEDFMRRLGRPFERAIAEARGIKVYPRYGLLDLLARSADEVNYLAANGHITAAQRIEAETERYMQGLASKRDRIESQRSVERMLDRREHGEDPNPGPGGEL